MIRCGRRQGATIGADPSLGPRRVGAAAVQCGTAVSCGASVPCGSVMPGGNAVATLPQPGTGGIIPGTAEADSLGRALGPGATRHARPVVTDGYASEAGHVPSRRGPGSDQRDRNPNLDEDRTRARALDPGEPVDRRALRGRHPRRRGHRRRRRAARRPDRPAHRPLAPRTSSSSTSRRAEAKVWWGEVNQPISEAHYDRLRARLVDYLAERGPVRPGLLHRRRTRRTAARCASTPRPPGRASSPATCSAARRAEELAGLRPELHDHRRPVVQGRPGDRGHPHRDGDPRPPAAGWRSSSSAPSTPARSRSRPSRS